MQPGADGAQASVGQLSRRDSLWVLRRCGRQGHVLGWVADPAVA